MLKDLKEGRNVGGVVETLLWVARVVTECLKCGDESAVGCALVLVGVNEGINEDGEIGAE